MAINQVGNLSVGNIGTQTSGPSAQPVGKGGPSFQDILKNSFPSQAPAQKAIDNAGLIFSKHAVERLQSRGIPMGPESLKRLNTALEKAQAKGSKDTLVLMDDSAFIMNVKNKTVVTAMDKAMLKENLFTNIDSTIIV